MAVCSWLSRTVGMSKIAVMRRTGIFVLLYLVAGIGAWVPSSVAASHGEGANPPELAALFRVQDGIRLLDVTEDITVTNRRVGGAPEVARRTLRIRYDRALGKVRRDLISPPRVVTTVRHGRNVEVSLVPTRILGARTCEPAWLFELLDRPGRGWWRRRSRGDGSDLELVGTGPVMGQVLRNLGLSSAGLPVTLRTFGSRGQVLDEATIEWEHGRGIWYPSRIVLVQHGVFNRVTREVWST